MGGIAVDTNNQTSIEGLYAVGETASTGVHGANRLASNSLLECIVYAGQLSKLEIPSYSPKLEPKFITIKETNFDIDIVKNIREQLPSLVWQSAGICRSQEVMEKAIAQIQTWRKELLALELSKYILELSPTEQIQFSSPDTEEKLRIYTETLNLIDIANLILKSALFRTESRGGHYRLDYPHNDSEWELHTVIQGNNQSKSI